MIKLLYNRSSFIIEVNMAIAKTTTIEGLMDEWSRDSIIEEMMAGKKSLEISVLHNKYCTFLINHNLISRKLGFDIQDLKAKKFLYYQNKLDDGELKELGWPRYYNTLMKADIPPVMDSDKDIINMNLKKIMHEEIVEMCRLILKELNNRTFQIKNYLDQERLMLG